MKDSEKNHILKAYEKYVLNNLIHEIEPFHTFKQAFYVGYQYAINNKCKCTVDETTGYTEIMQCNICGLETKK